MHERILLVFKSRYSSYGHVSVFNKISGDFILKQRRDNDKSYRVKFIKL